MCMSVWYNTTMLDALRKELQYYADPEKAIFLKRFFKTGKGEYAEGDIFLGIKVPNSRKIALQFQELRLDDVMTLLHSKIHEERLIALLILILQFKKADETQRSVLYKSYLANSKYINNWDLVDTSADKIVGTYLLHYKSESEALEMLSTYAKSELLWERRIAMLATFAYINNGNDRMTYAIADILLRDKHDLIHKAVGWLLREAGKKVSLENEEEFLRTRYKTMPRTMLRYAIERFSEMKRRAYLEGSI